MDFPNKAEILNDNHRFITYVQLINFEETKNLFTLVPRNLFGSPVPFYEDNKYNIICQDDEYIYFFQAIFKEITSHKDQTAFRFEVLHYDKITNVRKETRDNVECDAIISNFEKISRATILDLSSSGLKMETYEPISSEFVQIFFDDKNVPKRASGKIIWEQQIKDKDKFLYGVEVDYR